MWDVTGRTLYAGFIESGTTLFLPEVWKPAAPRADDAPPAAPAPAAAPRTGTYSWNSRVTPERSAARVLAPDAKGIEKLRALGFTTANVTPARGIFRGTGALVGTGTAGFNTGLVRPATAQELAFEFGNFADRTYPTSLMGAMALVRQTLSEELSTTRRIRLHRAIGLKRYLADQRALLYAFEALAPVAEDGGGHAGDEDGISTFRHE